MSTEIPVMPQYPKRQKPIPALAGDVFQGVLAYEHAADILFVHAESQLKVDCRGKRKHHNRREKRENPIYNFF
jgi:hypothetical protein